jgi:hypothetical protein
LCGKIYHFGPTGQSLSRPASLMVKYEAKELSTEERESLGLYVLEEDEWVPIAAIHDVKNSTFKAAIDRLGAFSVLMSESAIAAETESDSRPTTFAISQNYPNPFNPMTEIKFQIPEDNHVSIVVYNVQGQFVADLMNEHKDAGFYNVRWDGTNAAGMRMPTGVYIYRIEAGTYVDSKKMILLK